MTDNPSVLITGGAGFVGSAFAKRLARDGWHVIVVDNFSSNVCTAEELEAAGVWLAAHDDIRDSIRSGNLEPWQDLIIHCAAVVGGRLKIEGDPLAVATDLAIDSDFFNWIARSRNKQQRVVYFSSSAVYPVELQSEAQHCALSESMVDLRRNRIGMPDQTYGWSKLTGELLAQHAVQKYGTKVVIYRPFSGYGEGQSFDYPFPSIVKRVLDGEDPVTVWGSGKQTRDWVHIDDIVDCVLQTYEELYPGEVLNIGRGLPISFSQLAAAVCGFCGSSARIEPDMTKPEGVVHRCSDPQKMLTYYTPKVSLIDGIRRVAKSLDKHKEPV